MPQDAPNEQLQDRAFNPYRIPKTEKVAVVIDSLIGQLLQYEEYKGIRKRKRSNEDMLSFKSIVTAITCDLIHNQLTTPEKLIYISLSKRILGASGRYISPIMTKVLPDAVKRLAAPEMAYAGLSKGAQGFDRRSNKRSTISCGPRLINLITEHSISLADLMQDCTQETIILKSTKEGYFDAGERLEYKDSEHTNRYRSELLEINTWLAQSDICSDDPSSTRILDTSDRLLKRYFSNNSFESGGRFFGGFWQAMSKAHRTDNIVISEESITTLDYSQAAPRIAYGIANASPPEGDAYTLPSGRYNRKDIKTIFNAMIYADHPLTRFPKGTKKEFGRRTRFADVSNEIFSFHQPISHLFGKGVGLQLMFLESQILMSALLECKNHDIVALPVHDALIVARSNKKIVKEIMLTAFNKIANTQGKVEEEG